MTEFNDSHWILALTGVVCLMLVCILDLDR